MLQLRPSAASIWTKCALAPRLWSELPPGTGDGDSDPAREGTCAAWLAEMVLTGIAPDCVSMVGAAHENGWTVDTEMAGHIQGYVDFLRSKGGTIHTERKVRLNHIIAGTPDSFAVFNDGVVIVDDLKYGYDIVEPTTPQLAIYAGAIVRMLMSTQRIAKVRLGIYQPRAQHPSGIYRSRELWPEELMREVHEIEAAAEAAQLPSAVATPGAHCRYCDAAHRCSAVTHEVYARHTMLNGQQRDLTADEMSRELLFLDETEAMMKGRRDAIRAEAAARMKRGENIPGWHMQQGYGRRRWTADRTTVHMMTGVDPTSDSMVTPAELERRGASKETIAVLTETPRTKASVKRVPDGFYSQMFKQGNQP